MSSVDGKKIIVFNGEIYNFLELREELKGVGCSFRGKSDTEVMLAAYETWGDACLGRLNGMFSFVIYDSGGGAAIPSLFMARDRVGKKPFYYRKTNRQFEFASELKALSFESGVDMTALNFYLALGYVPGEQCIMEGVRKLPAATRRV